MNNIPFNYNRSNLAIPIPSSLTVSQTLEFKFCQNKHWNSNINKLTVNETLELEFKYK